MISLLRSVTGSILEFIYPPLCLACGSLLPNSSVHVCGRCQETLVRTSDHPELAEEVRGRLQGIVDEVWCPYVFQKSGPLQSLIHALKYDKMEHVGTWLGERLGEELERARCWPEVFLPVPLHRAKMRERGYNQAEVIATGCAHRKGCRVVAHALRRTKNTRTQTKLSIEQRNENVSDVFEVDPATVGAVEGKCVLVVDDVITTGATIGACARALRRAGATRVLAGAAALADHAD